MNSNTVTARIEEAIGRTLSSSLSQPVGPETIKAVREAIVELLPDPPRLRVQVTSTEEQARDGVLLVEVSPEPYLVFHGTFPMKPAERT